MGITSTSQPVLSRLSSHQEVSKRKRMITHGQQRSKQQDKDRQKQRQKSRRKVHTKEILIFLDKTKPNQTKHNYQKQTN